IRRMRHIGTVLIHLSFGIILVGAFLSYVTSYRGIVHLREGETTGTCLVKEGSEVIERPLPFNIRMERFEVSYHNGTPSVSDYTTRFTVYDGTHSEDAVVSMNNIFSYKGIRLYQSSFDEDMKGSILSLYSDKWGIPVTYTGYMLLFLSLIWMLLDPKGSFRKLLRHPLVRRGTAVAALLLAATTVCHAATAPPKDVAERFGELHILYKGRISPVETFAIDFTKKLYGKASYKGFSAEQVLMGFLFKGNEWNGEQIIKIKNGPLREQLQLPEYCSQGFFFNASMGGYILGPYVSEYHSGQDDAFHRDVNDIDDRLMLIMEVRHGNIMKLFPCANGNAVSWFAAGEKLPSAVSCNGAVMSSLFARLRNSISSGDYDEASAAISAIASYQEEHSGGSLPSPLSIGAERLYNRIPFATLLFMFNLTMGFLALFIEMRDMMRRNSRKNAAFSWLFPAMMTLSAAALTLCLALRWIIGGTIPMSNGYETMLFVAWCIMLLSLVACGRFRISVPFGFIMSGFCLLVSHISQMNPDISHVMPVLNSPLLSIHVSVIMISFALLSLTFICGITALALHFVSRLRNLQIRERDNENLVSLHILSRLLLYPALACLGIGIFVGAIWANVSWGQYWGWDPKEVWALITFMLYAIAVHSDSLPFLRRPLCYHAFMTFVFLAVIMTYFGVNYILGGMHSYA
ncbi:MAG: cytochrome c biogenesis protein CcsA, partial [Prevotella sp.]